MLIIRTINGDLQFYMPNGCNKNVIESQLLKDLNGTNTPFIVITNANGENTIINKNNIISVVVEASPTL